MSRYVKRPGDYPRNSDPITQQVIHTGKKEILVRTYETQRTIQLYFGGKGKWCVHVELITDPDTNQLRPIGYLVKIRYDELCSLSHALERGGDTKLLMNIVLQYVAEHYPAVTHLSFNDLSTRTCDNQTDVNLAVMTVFYTGGTWYQKNFGAILAPQSVEEWERYKTAYDALKTTQSWEIIRETITNHAQILDMTNAEMEALYTTSSTWENFFQALVQRYEIGRFCMFVSEWIDRWIAKYFNNLQGLTYWMPVTVKNVSYRIQPFQEGGKTSSRRLTRKRSRRMDRDEK